LRKTGDYSVGLFKPNIAKLAEKKDVSRLIEALDHKDPEIRVAATRALGLLGAPEAAAAIVNVLKDSNSVVCQAAAEALENFGEPAVAPLVEALKQWDEVTRVCACDVLVKIGIPALESLTVLLKHDESNVRNAAVDTVCRIGGEKAVEFLIAAAKGGGDSVRKDASDALVKIGEPAVTSMIGVLKDEKLNMEAFAREVLRRIGEPSVQPLLNMLDDDSLHARCASADVLVSIGSPKALKPLVALLTDPSPSLRRSSAQAIEKIGMPDDPSVRACCLVARRDWNGAASLGDVSLEPLLSAFKGEGGWNIANALASIGDPAVDRVISMLSDTSEAVRCKAAEALRWMRSRKAVEPLIAALGDARAGVRAAAAKSLEELGGKRAVERIVETFVAQASSHGDEASVERLIYALDDRRPRVREAAANTLVNLGVRCVKPLIAALPGSKYDTGRSISSILIRLYHCEQLDDKSKQEILSMRKEIAWSHYDEGLAGTDDHSDQPALSL
jgi:HEAT repeat protein